MIRRKAQVFLFCKQLHTQSLNCRVDDTAKPKLLILANDRTSCNQIPKTNLPYAWNRILPVVYLSLWAGGTNGRCIHFYDDYCAMNKWHLRTMTPMDGTTPGKNHIVGSSWRVRQALAYDT